MIPKHIPTGPMSSSDEPKLPTEPASQEANPKPFSIMNIHVPRKTPSNPSSRPTLNRTPSVQTRYMNMLLALGRHVVVGRICDEKGPIDSHNTWIFSAAYGFVFFRGVDDRLVQAREVVPIR
ncbi:hypothetical protein BU16DRAFT_198842 [Lophium mytilinum]|uniref:Uncharacterized protein n=1 Tax=Lophium mytilinum TaxID=390894 RepID=A0A6A6RCF2_9PEZI|nr:hypothetical protein BU16DRAFT_198842 [Lophium mytilinum]